MSTKICKKCLKEFDLSFFYKQKGSKDGLRGLCKKCHGDSYRHITNKAADKYRKSDYGRENIKIQRKKTWPRLAASGYTKIVNIVYRAVKNGQLVRQPCGRCGSTSVQAHHEDYSKPLEVVWLCRTHHAEVHREKNLKDFI